MATKVELPGNALVLMSEDVDTMRLTLDAVCAIIALVRFHDEAWRLIDALHTGGLELPPGATWPGDTSESVVATALYGVGDQVGKVAAMLENAASPVDLAAVANGTTIVH